MNHAKGRRIEVEEGEVSDMPAEDDGSPEVASDEDQPDAATEDTEDVSDELDDIEALRERIEQLEEQLAEEHDRHLRAVAELQNYRKRVAREQREKSRYASQDVLSRILPVMDNLRRVLEHQAEANREEFARGVEMTVEEFFRILQQVGVEVIDCEGQPFDPSRHEAVARVETDEVPEGTIIAVDTPGYCLHDRCLRPARVVVSASPEKSE